MEKENNYIYSNKNNNYNINKTKGCGATKPQRHHKAWLAYKTSAGAGLCCTKGIQLNTHYFLQTFIYI